MSFQRHGGDIHALSTPHPRIRGIGGPEPAPVAGNRTATRWVRRVIAAADRSDPARATVRETRPGHRPRNRPELA
jgi:hypothetical protein